MLLNGSKNTIRLDLPASYQYLHLIGPCLRALLEEIDEPTRQELAYNSELAVYETCTNIVEHAYGGGTSGRIELTCSLQEKPRSLVVSIQDTGRALELPLQEPSMPDPSQGRGYGLFLVYQLMDKVAYYSDAHGNHWQLVKHL